MPPRSTDSRRSALCRRVSSPTRELLKLEVLPAPDPEELVFPWTQIPVLKEDIFEARILHGEPVLVPIEREQPARDRRDQARASGTDRTREAAVSAGSL